MFRELLVRMVQVTFSVDRTGSALLTRVAYEHPWILKVNAFQVEVVMAMRKSGNEDASNVEIGERR